MAKIPLPGATYAERTIRRITQYHPSGDEKVNTQMTPIDQLRACLTSSFPTLGRNTGEDDEHDQHSQKTPTPRNTPNMTPSPSFCQPTQDRDASNCGRETEVDLPTQSSFSVGDDSSSDVGLFSSSAFSDNSDDSSADASSSFFGQPVTPEKSSATASRLTGLGISGIARKDGSAPFDGLGLVSIKASPWNPPSPLTLVPQDHLQAEYTPDELLLPPPVFEIEASFMPVSDSVDNLSRTLLEETLLTFQDDPFHYHTFNSIPECGSWYGIEQRTASQSTPSPGSEDQIYHFYTQPLCTSSPRMKRNFASPTISSMLKRSSTLSALPRARSDDWHAPSRASSLPPSRSGVARPAWRL